MRRTTGLQAAFIAVATLFAAVPVMAQISLGTSQSFAVLGGSTVTNTGSSVINGNVGVSPGPAVTGFPPGTVVGGAIHQADAVAAQAQADRLIAYNAIAGTACTLDLTGQDLGALGLPLTPGVYCFTSSAFLTGTLILDMQGNPDAVFLFKIGTTLTTASSSTVLLINNAGVTCPRNIYWQIGTSAVLGTNSVFVGNILADASITLTTGTALLGRALAGAAVTLDTNTVSACAPAIVCPVITVNPATLPNGNVGTAYNQAVTASGGVPNYFYGVTSGTLPTGLSIDSATGVISGNPSAVGTFNFTITATDANGCPGSRAYTIIIAAAGCPVIVLSPATLPPGTSGLAYSQTISASGGTAPYRFTIATGSLPSGLTLDETTGVISGVPTRGIGLFTFTVRATATGGCQGTLGYSILIRADTAPATGPTLDGVGLTILVVLLAVAGMFVLGKGSM